MIVFSNVSKQFFNDTFGVKNMSFAIEPGELVMITGRTGSGKTTLMRLMTREYDPSEGEVYFESQPLSEMSSADIPLHRRRIGVVFQDYRLLPESNVWENVALPLMIAGKTDEEIEERVTDLLELVELSDKADLFPRELSGGEAQRVGIARALATAPPVIFADEPTGNLDKDTAKSIVKLLKKINELGTTVFLATHDLTVMDELKHARRIELNDGQIEKDSDEKPINVPAKTQEKQEKAETIIENLEDNNENKDNSKEDKEESVEKVEIENLDDEKDDEKKDDSDDKKDKKSKKKAKKK